MTVTLMPLKFLVYLEVNSQLIGSVEKVKNPHKALKSLKNCNTHAKDIVTYGILLDTATDQ